MRAPQRGFTLIELLIVLTIVGVLAGVVALNFFGAGRERGLQTEAERLAALVELARMESMNRNEAWGLFIYPSEYGFAAYDDEAERWQRHTTGTFRSRSPAAGVSLEVTVEQREEQLEAASSRSTREGRQDVPRILILPGGEQTPFSVRLVPEWGGVPWIVQSDGIQRTRAQREGDAQPEDGAQRGGDEET